MDIMEAENGHETITNLFKCYYYFSGIRYYDEEDWADRVPEGLLAIHRRQVAHAKSLKSANESVDKKGDKIIYNKML